MRDIVPDARRLSVALAFVYAVGPRHALHAAGGRMLMMNLATDALVDVPKLRAVSATAIPALGSGWITYAFWNKWHRHASLVVRNYLACPSRACGFGGANDFSFQRHRELRQ